VSWQDCVTVARVVDAAVAVVVITIEDVAIARVVDATVAVVVVTIEDIAAVDAAVVVVVVVDNLSDIQTAV